MKLSDAQVHMLAEISNGKMTSFRAAMTGRGWRKTIVCLEDLGLVTWQPYATGGNGNTSDGTGRYAITADGRAKVAELIASGAMVVEP